MKPLQLLVNKIVFICLISISTGVLVAQDVAVIKGKVLDGETGLPLPFASVYINNTSLGVIADSTGNFYLKDVPAHFTDLVFSFIGYETLVAKISLTPGKVLNIHGRLRPVIQQLNEVVVKSSRGFLWKKDLDRFKKELFGTSQNASSCEILNAGGLNFSTTPHSFSASAARPLEIVNHALGYHIQLTLQSFEVSATSYKILFLAHFTDLIPKDDREKFRWELNRSKSYHGSLRHFLRSLINNRASAEGFRVYFGDESNPPSRNNLVRQNLRMVPPAKLVPKDIGENHNQYEVLANTTYEIHYLNKRVEPSERWYYGFPYPVSWLAVSDKSLVCRSNGMLTTNSKCVVSGSMNEYRVADALPENYDTDLQQKSIYNASLRNQGNVEGEVRDSSTLLPVQGAKIFINNSLFKTEADSSGRFRMENIPSGIYDVVIAYSDYSPQARRLEIKAGITTAVKFQISLKQPEHWQQSEIYDRKKGSFIRRYLVSSSLTTVRNPAVLEMKEGINNTSFRTKGALEVIDKQNGYSIHYYLKTANVSGKDKKNGKLIGFTSFDTLSPSSPGEKDTWQTSRREIYQGSFKHFVKSLIEGRAKEEGFEVFSSSISNPEKSQGKKTMVFLPGDSLLKMSSKQGMFDLVFPPNTMVSINGAKGTWITSDSAIHISGSGVLGIESELSLNGPMQETEIHSLPLDFLPTNETFTSDKVWAVVIGDQLKTIDGYREKPFLHTDKGYYYPGEKIWYKAYLYYSSWQFRDSLSKVLHVQLINSKRNIVKNSVLRIEDGIAWGDFVLPDTLQPGNYYLRAYTEWALNFGTDDISLQLIPIISLNQNIEDTEVQRQTQSYSSIKVVMDCDRPVYKPREKISITLRVTDHSGLSTNSNLSLSVTDAEKISRAYWMKSIVEDSIRRNKKDPKYNRLIYPIEKDFVYRGEIGDDQKEGSVFVFRKNKALNNTQILSINKGKFMFPVDFYDTASFYFHPYLKSGVFGGKVQLAKLYSPPIVLPTPTFQFTFRPDNAEYRIRYSGNPAENSTLLKEVVVRGVKPKVGGSSLYAHSSLSGEQLVSLKRFSDVNGFVCALASATGGRCVITAEETYLEFFGRRAAVIINGTLWNDFNAIIPEEVVRVDIYGNPAVVSFSTKIIQNRQLRPKEMNLFLLAGYSSPSKFYMRDYSNRGLDDEQPDFRTTIYWDPNVNASGERASVSFYAADLPGRYRIVVQGLSEEGQPIYGERIIEVKK